MKAELKGCLVSIVIGVVATFIGAPIALSVNGCKPDYYAGTRSGTLVKFSKGGLLTTTGEGTLHPNELGLGGAGNVWNFSCRDAAHMEELEQHVGKEVTIRYTAWLVTPWYQDTEFTALSIEAQ